MINTEIRDKFKKLYYEKFDIELSDEEATAMATDLVNLVKVLIKHQPKSTAVTNSQTEGGQYETIGVQHY